MLKTKEEERTYYLDYVGNKGELCNGPWDRHRKTKKTDLGEWEHDGKERKKGKLIYTHFGNEVIIKEGSQRSLTEYEKLQQLKL